MTIRRGDLSFAELPEGGYACNELAELPSAFEARWGEEHVRSQIDQYLKALRASYTVFVPKEERGDEPTPEQYMKGGEIFDRIRASISTEGMTLFQEFLFWLSSWNFYHEELRRETQTVSEFENIAWERRMKIHRQLLPPVLPSTVNGVIRDMEVLAVAVNFGHFAILFGNQNCSTTRRIVTDTQLFEIRGVEGYVYLDITPEGKPVARSRCRRGGERAFFDGVRLMSHDRFKTCAPKTVMIDGGYKVNSTRCTIVNGQLFELIDVDDKVAYTTGRDFFTGLAFNNSEALESFRLSEASGAHMRVTNGKVLLDGTELVPIGTFLSSKVTLLETGFALYDWSEFMKPFVCAFDHVLVVDDQSEWIDKVRTEFGSHIKRLETFQTGSSKNALVRIQQDPPDALVLDMHLTPDERFEGLWIANQLVKSGFNGAILIASGYPEPQLMAMAALIPGKVQAPGKNIDKLRACLSRR